MEGVGFLKQTVRFDENNSQALAETSRETGIFNQNQKKLKSIFRLKRIKSAVNLGTIGTQEARKALENALVKERNVAVRLYIANALSDIHDEGSIQVLVESLLNSKRWYRDKVNMLIAEYGNHLQPLLSSLMEREEIEIKELMVDYSSIFISGDLKQYLFTLIDNLESEKNRLIREDSRLENKKCCGNCRYGRKVITETTRFCEWNGNVEKDYYCSKFSTSYAGINPAENYEKLVYKAAGVAATFYFYDLTTDKYIYSTNDEIRNIAVKSLANINTKENYIKLIKLLPDEVVAKSALSALSKFISEDPVFIDLTVGFFEEETNDKVKDRLAEALSGRIEYFIMRLLTAEGEKAVRIIRQLLLLGKTSELIGFMNKNKDIEIENDLITMIKDVVSGNEAIEKEFCIYLQERLLKKAGLIKCDRLFVKKEHKKDGNLIKTLSMLLLGTVLMFPLIYCIRHFPILSVWSFVLQAKTYIIDFNYYVVFYSALINIIYLVLLFLSRINVSRQAKLWSYKGIPMLFKKRMLPGVSIIAPAYNEEKIIIESVNSLLNLKYPDYELIVVNDGSADDTLNTLIQYFNLQRVDYVFEKKLNTEPIRGIYTNPSYPGLIVVDKENAGKADSLNAGIIASNKEYFCCIDSDSLLEEEALLRLASQTLDEETETPALGGNVFPSNGCKVKRGFIEEIRIPDNKLARFQTIEYIRAFMAGRLGWAYMNSLLIISGAFGLFRKERVIHAGGYLTSNEKYKKDTVGEDMELVVRITRMMREQGHKYKINYCYNANCWTEVPEKWGSLKKQRYRWHRGLVEILHFHRKTLFNPRYGRMGLFSMPYFFIFEMAGPLIEIQGYFMVLAAFLLGILNWQIALLLFVSSIMLGVLVSLASLIIAEKDNLYYGYGDVLKLAFFAVIENFGVRQIFSLWRVIAYLKMFAGPQGWGSQERKGFAEEMQSAPDKGDKAQ